MLKTVEEFVSEYKMFADGDNVVLGLSGGADSVCLLYMLKNLTHKYRLNILAVHVNHGIRETAGRDENFSKDLCDKLGIDFRAFKIDCVAGAKECGLSVEETGRNERYRLFKEAGDEVFGPGLYKIAVAHHRDDLAETMIFNLARGTGLNGLAAIRPVNGNIVRPLLSVGKEEIEAYLIENKIAHVEDETNESNDYSRNKVRHVILPVMNELNESAALHIANTASQLASIEDYLNIKTDEAWEECVREDGQIIILDKIKELHPAIARRLVHKALVKAAGCARDISSVQLEAVMELFDNQVGKKRDLIYRLEAKRVYEGVCIKKSTETEENSNDLASRVVMEVVKRDFSQNIPVSQYTKWLDYDKITNCPIVRFRQPGDYICINDAGDRKLLSDYMINEKIPSEERDKILLVADGNHILWVVGYRISSMVKVSDKTTNILKVTYNEVN